MHSLSALIFWTCIGYAAYHFAWAAWFRWILPSARSPKHPDFQPSAVVILSLRGKDPFVGSTIRSLLDQDYSQYELKIIVDSSTDPVWETLREFENHPRIRISILEERLKTCSLKCSAIVQAIREISPKTEVIALADADIVPSRYWLQRIVSPLKDPEIGVVTGNQWFSPKQNRVGSVVRSLWNAGALVVTFLFKHTWAGSCAMRLQDVKDCGLIEKWRKTIVDDGPIDGAMRKLSCKTVFVSDLISVNSEECDFAFSIRYNSRMLTWSRIYEWGFVGTFLHMLFTILMIGVALALTIMEFASGSFVSGFLLIAGLLTIQLALFAAYLLTESALRAVGGEIKEQLAPVSVSRYLKFFVLIPVALVVYSIAALRATFTKQVQWRDATYEIKNGFEIRLLEDQPFSASSLPVDQTSSI
ncbi:MAG: glycosyltransferase [Planctomycetota bacterium]|nr:glycosyltransferase [Planctomycetota bacterium]